MRQLNKHDRDICDATVSNLLEQGVIRKSTSPWRHLPVVVPKRNGGSRMAIDYRPVNKVTEFDAFPTPSISELLEKLHGVVFLVPWIFLSFITNCPCMNRTSPRPRFVFRVRCTNTIGARLV